MYLTSGSDYYLAVLEGIDVTCKSGLVIRSPNIKFRLLTLSELSKTEVMKASGMLNININDEIVDLAVLGIIGFEGEKIDFENSPAFVADHLADKIRLNTKTILEDLEGAYNEFITTLNLIEIFAMIVSYYSNTSYENVMNLSLDEVIKRYTICSKAFPHVVPPIKFEEEKSSKVG